MYRTGRAPVVERAPGTIPLRLTGMVRRELTGGSSPTDAPVLHRYYADLAALYGVEYLGEVLAANAGNTFGALAGTVLDGLVSPDRPVDLVIIAHALPDLDPRLSPGVCLARDVPGEPLVFAVSETDGPVSFTVLRVAGAYARRHSYRRVVVLVLDQATLPYRAGAEPAGDAAVALLLEDGPGAEIAVGRVPDVAPRDVPSVVAAVAGDRARIVRADEPGAFPATGVWAGLDRERGGHSVLVHHGPGHRDLHYCSIRDS